MLASLEILTALSRHKLPSGNAIGKVVDALNGKVTSLRYRPMAREDHWIVTRDPVREAAEILIEYLQLVAKVGPVHTICKQCGRIVLSGRRRTKEYCSDRCRAAFWNYARIKQTYWNTPANQRKRELGRTKTVKKRPAKVTESPKRA